MRCCGLVAARIPGMRLGKHPDSGLLALSNMRRHVFLGRVILLFFFSYSLCLPIDHTCIDGTAAALKTTVQRPAPSRCGGSKASITKSAGWLGLPHATSRNGRCLACLWSQTLQLHKLIAGLGIPQFLSTGGIVSAAPFPAIASILDAAPKRAPPISQLS